MGRTPVEISPWPGQNVPDGLRFSALAALEFLQLFAAVSISVSYGDRVTYQILNVTQRDKICFK
jgi:hypothetical protein